MQVLSSIKTRLTFWYLLVVAIILVFWSFAAYGLLSNGLKQKNLAPISVRVAEIAINGNNVSVTDKTGLTSPDLEIREESPVLSLSFTVKQLLATRIPF